MDYREELEKLGKFHEQLAQLEEPAGVNMLRSGFMPDSPEALREAGIRCIPLIASGDMDVGDAARDRLQGILVKLRSLPFSAGSRDVVGELEAQLREHQARGRRDTLLGFAAILFLLVAIVSVALWIIRVLTQ